MKYDPILCMMVDDSVRTKDARVSTRNVTTSGIAFEEIKKMTGIIPERAQQKGDTMEFYHKGKKVAEWDMNNAEVKVFDQKTIDEAIRNCDANHKFTIGDLVRYYNSIYKIISYNEKDNTYSLVSIPGGGSRLISDRIDKEGKKISKIPKGIFTDQWG